MTACDIELVELLSTYATKYMRKVWNDIKHVEDGKFRLFQKELVKVSTWSDSKKEKEYMRFAKWCMKRRSPMSENDIQCAFDNIIIDSVKLLLGKNGSYDIYDNNDIHDLFYRCIKRFSRLYYEKPERVVDTENKKDAFELTKTVINSFIPLQKVLKIIEQEKSISSVSYDFDKSQEKDVKVNVIVEKQEASVPEKLELRYVSSDEVYKEYYQSDEDKPVKSKTKVSMVNDEKHIEFQKVNNKRVR